MSKSDKPDKSSKPEQDSNLIIEYCEDIFAKLKKERENRLVTKQPKHSYSRHTATVLQDGRVLLISCDGSEIFDPKGNAFYCPEPSKLKQEANLAVLLLDGRVLVVSSSRRPDAIQAEIFDPVQETWEEMKAPKYDHAQGQLTLLANGQVLATGGAVSVGPPRYVDGHTHCEAWDPTTGEWTEAEPLNHGRYDHCAVALADGSVVVIGGATKAIEQRRPNGSWHKVAELPYNLYEHQAVLLKEHILIIGGRTKRPSEAYAPVDTQKNTWLLQLADFKRIPAGDMLKDRSSMVALLVQDDQVIVIGGSCESQSLKTTEFWSLEKKKWSRGSNLGTVWSDHTASLLRDGRVFLLKNNSSDLVSPKPGLGCEKNCDPAYNQQVLHEGVEVEHGPWNIEHDDGTHEDGVFHYGKKEGQWNYWDFDEKVKVTHYANDLKEGLETLCWPGNRIQATQEFRGGAEHGVHREYDYTSQSDGKLQLKLEAHYQNGELHGSYKKWDYGKLELDAHYHQGELHGSYKMWLYEDEPVRQGFYQHGKKHGEWITMYYGKPKSAGNYINGLKDGEWIYSDIHDEEEQIGNQLLASGKGVWRNNIPMDGFFFFKEKTENGMRKRGGTFKAGQKHGIIQEWDYFGVLREITYVNGVMEGLFTEFRDENTKAEEGHYRDNQKHGRWLKWFSNGVILSDGSYVDGKKQGEWKTFNYDGELEK